ALDALSAQPQAALYPQPMSEPLPAPYLHTYAELIQPRTIDTFTHLASYEGHARIGNSRIQAIVAGVAPKIEPRTWTPLILAYFRRYMDTWEKLESVSDTTFKRSVQGRPADPQIEAIVPSINQPSTSAHLDVVYSRSGGGANRE